MSRRQLLGFTLIELIIVIIILGIIAAIAAPILNEGFQSYFGIEGMGTAYAKSELALARLSRDLRQVGYTTAITTATATQLVFTADDNSTVTYSRTGNSLMRNSSVTGNQVLANNVTAINLSYFTSGGVATSTLSLIRYIGVNLTFATDSTTFTTWQLVNPRDMLP